jgi:hypothetical protein
LTGKQVKMGIVRDDNPISIILSRIPDEFILGQSHGTGIPPLVQ